MWVLLLIVLLWFLIGFIATTIVFTIEVRGVRYDILEFDSNYDDKYFLMMICFGPLTFIAAISIMIRDKRVLLKLFYKLANIGVKKEDKTSD